MLPLHSVQSMTEGMSVSGIAESMEEVWPSVCEVQLGTQLREANSRKPTIKFLNDTRAPSVILLLILLGCFFLLTT